MIPFNKPFIAGNELRYVQEAVASGHLAGDGSFTRRCHEWMATHLGLSTTLLTTSCTSALEMSAILCDIGPGDEVIMPSYTFVTTANAFVRQGATPVFVDVREDTLNMDETLVEAAITERTKAIVPVHYAGVGCAMDAIMAIARRHGLRVIEDAAQAVGSTLDGKVLGGIGDLGCFSFHETKNFIAGEGGALVVNDPALVERAEIVREKGTNRSRFFRGQVDKYTWVDVGSSFLPSELIAAFLYGQLEEWDAIMNRRLSVWEGYHRAFADLVCAGRVGQPRIPAGAIHNGHLYFLLCADVDERTALIAYAAARGVKLVFHYVPLHSSPKGREVGRVSGAMDVTDSLSERLVRLPLYYSLTVEEQQQVIDTVHGFYGV